MRTISYRKLAAADAGLYREIRLESLRLHPESFGSGYEAQRKLPKLMFERALEAPVDNRFLWGAFDGPRLIGICGYIPFVMGDLDTPDLRNTGTIIQMYVQAAYRGQKIGLALVHAVVREVFENTDMAQIILGVMRENARAIRVYEQAGFQVYDNPEAEPAASGELLMIKRREERGAA